MNAVGKNGTNRLPQFRVDINPQLEKHTQYLQSAVKYVYIGSQNQDKLLFFMFLSSHN